MLESLISIRTDAMLLFNFVILGLLGTEGKATPIKRDPCAHFPRVKRSGRQFVRTVNPERRTAAWCRICDLYYPPRSRFL